MKKEIKNSCASGKNKVYSKSCQKVDSRLHSLHLTFSISSVLFSHATLINNPIPKIYMALNQEKLFSVKLYEHTQEPQVGT